MLEVIAKLDSGIIRALLIAFVSLVGLILSLFGVDEALFNDKAAKIIEAVLVLLTTGSVLYAAWARAMKPTPPITETAKQATMDAVASGKLQTTTMPVETVKGAQRGFARVAMLAAWLAIGSLFVVSVGVTGCTHTRAALKAADTPSDYALVFLEGYDGALKSANLMRKSGSLSAENLARVRAAELKAWPLVERIDPLRRAYEQTQSAEDAAALQLAIDNAIREAAEFVRVVRELRQPSGG